ncbi:MAG: hypothetical protein WDM86_15810 [Rhizomicrobium sp.]
MPWDAANAANFIFWGATDAWLEDGQEMQAAVSFEIGLEAETRHDAG